MSIWSGQVGQFDTIPFTREDLESTDADKQREVQGWLNGISEPWSDTSVAYNIHPSYETGAIPEEERWVCDYNSIVYDGIEAHVRAHGNSPQTAFQKCIALIQELLSDYADSEEDEES
jgi:hypothetical protein